MKTFRPFCACLVALGCASVALAANDVWDANGLFPPTGIWGTNANWADNTTPGNADTATFNLGAAYTVIFNANPLAIQALTVTGTVPTFTSSGGARTLSVTSASGGQDVTVNGGVLALGTSGNPMHLTVGDDLTVSGNGLLRADFGSQINTLDLFLATVNGGGNGTVVVDGTNSRLNVTNDISMGFFGNTATLAYANNAQGTLNGVVTLAASGNAASAAALSVASGADVMTGRLNVGTGTVAATGTVNISGTGSTLTQTGAATITVGTAAGGIGNINIGNTADGGTLTTARTMTINATGTVTIGNAGAFAGTLNANDNVMINGGTLTRGSSNTGNAFNLAAGATMTIQNGGSASFAGSATAYTTASNATYNITGGGSLLETTEGHLAINNGAQVNVSNLGSLVSASRIIIGLSGDGTLSVDGVGSTATEGSGPTAIWGDNGNTATVTFSNGASGSFGSLFLADSSAAGTTAIVDVLSGADLMIGGIDLATVGGATTSATLNIQGSGSTVVQTGISPVDVGHNGTGTAVINIGTTASGATFTTGTFTILATGRINIGSGVINTGRLNANGDVTIDGGTLTRDAGSTFALADGKTMTIENGGSASFTNSYFTAANAIYNVSGPGSTLESVTGSVAINNAAQMNVSFGGLVSSAGIVSVGSGGNGTLTVDGSGSSLVSAGPTNTWGFSGNTAAVTFSNTATGTLSGDLHLAETATANTTAAVDVLTGADLSVGGNIRLTTAGGATSSAKLNVEGSGTNFTQTGAGTLTVGHATTGSAAINIGTTASGAMFTSAGAIEVLPTGVVTVGSATSTGTLNANTSIAINGGTIHLVDGVVNANSIALSGGGTFDFDGGTLHVQDFTGELVNDGGTLTPGQSAGITTITGSYAQQNAGTLQIEIGGLTPGTQHDRLAVSSILSLDGALVVLLINGFTPQSGNSFDILNWNILAGTFDTISLPALGAGLMWNASQLYTLGALNVALAGDYSLDGTVDAADYVVWRKMLGQNGVALAADGNGNGAIDPGDYTVWRSHFGQPPGSGSGASANAAVPEPATMVMLIVTAAGVSTQRRRRTWRVSKLNDA